MDIQIKTSTANVPITPTNNNYYNANLTSKPIKIDQLHPPKVRNITITTAKTIDVHFSDKTNSLGAASTCWPVGRSKLLLNFLPSLGFMRDP